MSDFSPKYRIGVDVGDTFIDAVVEGEDDEKLWEEGALDIPGAYTEKAIHLDVEDAPPDEPAKTLTERWQAAKAQGICLGTFADSEREPKPITDARMSRRIDALTVEQSTTHKFSRLRTNYD